MTLNGYRISFIPYYMISKAKWSAPKTDKAIRVLSELKYDGIEWMSGNHFNNVSELESLVSETRNAGLEISNIMSWQDLVTNEEEKRNDRTKTIESYIEAAGRLSIPVLNVFTGPMPWDMKSEKVGRDIPEGRAWSVVVDSFSSIEKVAKKNNVIVTVEAVFGMLVHDYYSMREFLSYFESSEHIGVNLDPSHLVLYGNDPAWAVTKLAERIKHVHVKDAAGRAGVLGEDFIFPFLGDGLVDWDAFFAALRSVDYSGYLSLEFENDAYLRNDCDGNWAVAAKKSRDRLEKLFQIR